MLPFHDIELAAARLKGVAHRTPVLRSRTLDAMLGLKVFMKAENLQRMGAFKFRGGYNAVNVQQTQAVGRHPFEVIRVLVRDVLTASDPAVVEAMRFAFERMKIVLEPSGACALAALMAHAGRFEGQRVGVTLSGGNIGPERFAALLSGAERVD
ncbi:MAG: pyridoxal-phosphate dependent enzyme [Pseudomonadota bacterium]